MNSPNRSSVWMVAVGAVVGVFLGPSVLGWVAPGVYEWCFYGGIEAVEVLEVFERKVDQEVQRLEATGVTAAAVAEVEARNEPQRRLLQTEVALARQARQLQWGGRSAGLAMAVVVVMVIELFVKNSNVLARLVRGRFALAGVWVALLVSRPGGVGAVPLVFVGLLVAVVLVGGWVLRGRGGD